MRSLLAVAAMATIGLIGSISTALAADPPISVPEPMTMGVLAAGAAGLIALRKFRGK